MPSVNCGTAKCCILPSQLHQQPQPEGRTHGRTHAWKRFKQGFTELTPGRETQEADCRQDGAHPAITFWHSCGKLGYATGSQVLECYKVESDLVKVRLRHRYGRLSVPLPGNCKDCKCQSGSNYVAALAGQQSGQGRRFFALGLSTLHLWPQHYYHPYTQLSE